jgi:HlyD family secretion protein
MARPGRLVIIGTIAAAAVAAGVVWVLMPPPIPVDIGTVRVSTLRTTVEEEGRTRVRHIYVVSAPLAGRVLRTDLHVGDAVTAGETVVARMQPAMPIFHDARTHRELEGALAAAEAAVQFAEAEVRRVEAAAAFARTEWQRAETLARTSTISARAADEARLALETSEAAVASARAQAEVRRAERDSAVARLRDASAPSDEDDGGCCLDLRAPAAGRVLRIDQESESVVQAGTPLVELGDPADLEVVADLLSQDAVQVEPGAPVEIADWGGPPLRGEVQRIDPSGFMKTSALGIEEQRVKTVVTITEPRDSWRSLGHDFRVLVRITTGEAEGVPLVPLAALFRRNEKWAVFAVEDGRARLRTLEIGRRNAEFAEVRGGLSPGDDIVLHPSDRVSDDAVVTRRSLE